MNMLEGKGFYIWKIDQCEGGDVNAIANLSVQAGLSHLVIKIADRGSPYNRPYSAALVQALRARGVVALGWHYVYGYEAEAEARVAIQEVQRLGLDGYVIDAEHQYKEPGKKAAALRFMNALRAGLPNTPVALSSYRYPSYHPSLPWREFLDQCDFNMPQVYWQSANNPAAQLERSLREFQGMTPIRTIFPTGAAYTEHNWTPRASEITAFLDKVQELNLPGANFWEWAAARRLGLWDLVARFPWRGAAPVAKDIAQLYVDALNTRRVDDVVALYNPPAVHVNATRTVQGVDAIRVWYAQLFTQILPNAVFTLTGYSGQGSSRHLTWTAVSSAGRVLNGNDTFGLAGDKISYHYAFFTVI